MNAVILINTIKLQESERFLTDTQNAQVDGQSANSHYKPSGSHYFDGVAGFAVGTDDTLRNMRWRLDRLTQMHPIGCIVNEILTVYNSKMPIRFIRAFGSGILAIKPRGGNISQI